LINLVPTFLVKFTTHLFTYVPNVGNNNNELHPESQRNLQWVYRNWPTSEEVNTV
jgi:hypothetical protein